MSLTERSERVLAEIDAGRMTHNVQIELIALVREYHAREIAPSPLEGLTIVAPAKIETKAYDDGSSATGPAPLPDHAPEMP